MVEHASTFNRLFGDFLDRCARADRARERTSVVHLAEAASEAS